mgnify:CR=1 FL=1
MVELVTTNLNNVKIAQLLTGICFQWRTDTASLTMLCFAPEKQLPNRWR